MNTCCFLKNGDVEYNYSSFFNSKYNFCNTCIKSLKTRNNYNNNFIFYSTFIVLVAEITRNENKEFTSFNSLHYNKNLTKCL